MKLFSFSDVCLHCFLAHSVLSLAVICGGDEVKLGRICHFACLQFLSIISLHLLPLFFIFWKQDTRKLCLLSFVLCFFLFGFVFTSKNTLTVKLLYAGVSEHFPNTVLCFGRKPESLASENSFVTHLCHPAHTLGGPWRNWILAWECKRIVPGDGCDTGSAWRGGTRARRRCPIATVGLHLQSVRRSIYLPRCCYSSSNGFVIGLRFSYISGNAVTSPRRPLLPHNLPRISPRRLCNASSKCSNLVCALGCSSWTTFWSFINFLVYLYIDTDI